MNWINVNEELPISPSKVIVITKTKHGNSHVLEINYHQTTDEKGVKHDHWGCNNQLVVKWLKEN